MPKTNTHNRPWFARVNELISPSFRSREPVLRQDNRVSFSSPDPTVSAVSPQSRFSRAHNYISHRRQLPNCRENVHISPVTAVHLSSRSLNANVAATATAATTSTPAIPLIYG